MLYKWIRKLIEDRMQYLSLQASQKLGFSVLRIVTYNFMYYNYLIVNHLIDKTGTILIIFL